MGCQNPKIVWNASRFKKMELGDPLPGSDDGVVTDEILDRLRSGSMGEEKRSLIRGGQYIPIDCRVCKSCLTKAINSRVGSMLAESQYSANSAFLTLTFAPDVPGTSTRFDLADQIIQKQFIREMTEKIRKDRSLGSCRWFASAERGELRGRVHWHMILFGSDGKFPEFDYGQKMSHSRLWPNGHINAQPMPDHKAMAYAAKYSVKSLAGINESNEFLPGVETAVSFSKYPPLGGVFFQEHGERLADYGVPLSMRFMPPGGDRKANYTIRRAARRIVANAYLDGLEAQGYDVSFYADVPFGHVPTGRLIPLSPDPWIGKLLNEVIRERRLASLPPVDPEQEAAELVAEFADRQLRQERANAAQAARRNALAVKRAYERNERALRGFRDDPDDPVWDDWDGASYAALARQIANGKW